MSTFDALAALGLRYAGDSERVINACCAKMVELGGVKLEASYSGGNDEGGIDNLTLFAADGSKVDVPSAWIEPDDPRHSGSMYGDGQKMPEWDENSLQTAAEKILGLEYGSWGGDFSAYGTLYVDANEQKAWREGSYEVPNERDDSAEF